MNEENPLGPTTPEPTPSRTNSLQCLFMALVLLAGLFANLPAHAQRQAFPNPRLGGFAVDRCLYPGSQCNQPAADAFCQRAGYARARFFRWAFMAPTRNIGSGQICNTPGYGGCGGFTFIECERVGPAAQTPHAPGSRTFNFPRLGRYAVDRCLYSGSQCDQPAADEFCRRTGYFRATFFRWDFMAPTQIMGTGQICTVPGRGGCGGFTQIVCTGRGGGSSPPPPPRGGMPGDPCRNNAQCRNGICLLGVCG